MRKVTCQCCSETLGSTSVKSGLCPSILHLHMKTLATTKIQFICIFTMQAVRVAQENRIKGESNFSFSYFPNPNSESAPKLKDPVIN